MIPTFASLLRYIRVPFWGLSSLHVCHQRGQARGHPGCWSPGRDRTGELRGHQSLHILPPRNLPTSHFFYQLLTRLAMCVGGSQAYKMIPRSPHLPSTRGALRISGRGECSVPPAAGLFCKACSDAFRELHVVTLSQDFT